MNSRIIYLTLTLAALHGCSLLHDKDSATIADLGKRAPVIDDEPLVPNEHRAMQAYRNFLATDDQSVARPEAMRRVADIGLESDSAPEPAIESVTQTGNTQQVQDSIALYQEVLEHYPDRPGNDDVVYQLARAQELAGNADKALQELTRLAREYPSSSHRTEADFRRGEIDFIRKRYREAAQAYRSVADNETDNPFLEQALYKLGWSYFKQGMYEESNPVFLRLLDRKLSAGGPGNMDQLGRADRERVEDSLRAMSLGFSYEDGAGSIERMFVSNGTRPYEDIVYANLGELYLSKERYTDAAKTLQTFVDNNPVHRSSPGFQMQVIEAYQAGGFPTLVLESKKGFVDRFNLQGEFWKHHAPGDTPLVVGFLKSTMTDLSRYYHAQARKDRKAQDFAEAEHWYRSFLGSFPDGVESPGMNFLLAELLFDSGNFRAASQEYTKTAYDYGKHTQAAEAGYASVLAYERQESLLSGSEQDSWHLALIENELRFASSFPQHPQALAVQTHAAEQLLALHDNTRAIQVAGLVTQNSNANSDQLRVCWTVLAHAWFDMEDYLQAEQAYQQVLARTDTNDLQRGEITEKLAASIYKQGEAANAAGDPVVAIGHFRRIRDAAPGASILATAEYDAAATQLGIEDWQGASSTLQQFRATFPDDPRQSEVTRRLATAYLNSDRPTLAAQEFERIAIEGADSTLRRNALWQAADLYASAGEHAKAVSAYRHYVHDYPTPAEPAIEARNYLAGRAAKSGDSKEQQHWLTEIIQADRDAGTERTARTRYLAASASIMLANELIARYDSVALTLPLERSLPRKKTLMQQTLAAYEQAAGYGIAEFTTAAAYHTAEVYRSFSQALMQSERPRNLDQEALNEYNILLEDQSYPFEEQAISLHETNATRLSEGVYDAWIGKSMQVLAELVPAKYAKQERSASYVASMY